MNGNDVVVAGMGVTAPGATTVDALADLLMSAKPVVEWLPIGDEQLPLVGCPVADGAWLDVLTHAERRRLDRIAHLGIAAAQQAVDAEALWHTVASDRRGLAVGIGFGGITTLTSQHAVMLSQGWRRLSPFGVVATMPSSPAAVASIRFDVQGPATTVSSACASGTHALIEGARMIKEEMSDIVLAGGAEAPLARLPMAAFSRMDAMAQPADDITTTCRPFDANRRGFVLGEGAGFVVLTRRRIADRAGVVPQAVVTGWGLTTDAHHVTAPDAGGPARSVAGALAMAGLRPDEIGHVNAHGTATKLNDAVEAAVLSSTFGAGAVPVTSNKGVIGHLMGAAGAVEAIATIATMHSGWIPPTANCNQVEDAMAIDVVRNEPRRIPVAPALTCSFGFGGQNASLVLEPVT